MVRASRRSLAGLGWELPDELKSAKCKVKVLVEGHKVTPVKAINKYNSRFAYKLKGFKGLWTLEGVHANNKTFVYREYKKGC